MNVEQFLEWELVGQIKVLCGNPPQILGSSYFEPYKFIIFLRCQK
jgi:hypothetical protein